MNFTAFKLEKLYLDCIDEEGNCFIAYQAKLQLSLLRLNYSGLIFSDSNNICVEKSALKKLEKPVLNNKLLFNNPKLKIKGSWEKIDKPESILLYKDAEGNELLWDCHHTKTLTEILYKNKSYKGYGYAETLSLPFKPWQLPIDELRWGRFLSETDTIIWINWKGAYPINKLIFNGTMYEDAVFDEDKLVFNKGNSLLLFNETTIIRKGKLSNILASMPWLKLLFKSKILNTVENKYKAKSTFKNETKTISKGWSLFEVVTFKTN